MRHIPQLALVAALALGAVSWPLPAQAPAPARDFRIGKAEREALAALQTATAARDVSGARAAYSAAQGVALSGDTRYLAGSLLFKLGLDVNDRQLQLQGIDAIIASGAATADELPALYRNQAALAASANDNKKAGTALTKLAELRPDDVETLIALAQLRSNQKRPADALALLDRAIAMQKAGGQPVPEAWYKFAVRNAFDAKLAPQTAKFARDWIAAYPSPQNWRDAIGDYRDVGGLDKAADLDALRLMRFTHALAGERDYYLLADALTQGGYAGESKAVLDEGIAAKMVDPGKAGKGSKRPAAKKGAGGKAGLATADKAALAATTGASALKAADSNFGSGDYAKAATLYRAALQKGGVDANLVNTRLGMALTLSGQKAEAEAALRSVAGPRADLAGFMLVWLAQRA